MSLPKPPSRVQILPRSKIESASYIRFSVREMKLSATFEPQSRKMQSWPLLTIIWELHFGSDSFG